MNKSTLPTTLVLLACTCSPASAQTSNPLSDAARLAHGTVKTWLVASAAKMPEQHYGFRPTRDVRSFGEIVGHIADVHYRFCSIALGEKSPSPNVEKTITGRAALIAALAQSVAYCDRAYAGLTDATAVELLKLGPGMPRLSVLYVNAMHATLHYGNLITYMRMKNVVPPSSEPPFVPARPQPH